MPTHKIGVLITNLGTPEEPTPAAVRRYLREFLSDPRVVELPKLLWQIILNLVVLNIRPRKSAHAYQKIWTHEGSPLLVITQKQLAALQSALPYPCDFAMRYGTPSISKALEALRDQGIERLLVLPLYPQYSATTTASTFEQIARIFEHWRAIPELHFINHYHDEPEYISACATQIQTFWRTHPQPEKLILSYHGLPKRNVDAGDPYYHQCLRTSELLREALNLPETQVLTGFQSRFGAQEWLKPYLDKTLKNLGKQRTQSVHIFCPGFSADCLETLEEINLQNQTLFKKSGGGEFHYIPALNNEPHHIEALTKIIEKHLRGWL